MIEELIQKQKVSLNHYFQKVDSKEIESVVSILRNCSGKIVFSGVGKSGIIAKKCTATFISMGINAFYLSPNEALHGDLGGIHPKDILLFFSKSGNTEELIQLIPHIQNTCILIHSNSQAKLLQHMDHSIYLPLDEELCPFDLIPTTSTTLQLLMGDLLAIALLKQKKIQLKDYAKNHPAGWIGKKAFYQVKDLMRKGERIPLCKPNHLLIEVLPEISKKACGCLFITNSQNELIGIFTDGDLRRSLEKLGIEALHKPLEKLMSSKFEQIEEGKSLFDALQIMENPHKKVTALPVLRNKKIVGLLHMHDLF